MDPYKRSRYDQGIDAKIVVMGNTGVGKTSLLQRYTQNKFDPKNTTSTTGAFFVTKKVYVNGLKVRLQLWDTAGQERFRSMAPMYYRGANAALLLYDITSVVSFEDVRGWLEELKKNCPTDLIIYIVGSKADLTQHRQVSSDLARLSLHQWFPPPRPPTPPPPPQPSTFSYIRPRFTSFTSIRSVPLSSPSKPSPPDSHSSMETSMNKAAALKRASTGMGPSFPAARSTGALLNRAKSTNGIPPSARYQNNSYLIGRPWNDTADHDEHSFVEDEEDEEYDDREWGLEKDMELFEVSAKNDQGIEDLFDSLISAIISKKDVIEQENEMKRRDSVFLTPVAAPTWAAQADEEEAREKAAARSAGWSCCSV
ncbi:ras-domain-containing protein [Dentipellis sp. KUC8613]|nr:ras-domain-containing protein [Dentipellis sp. KUC8613]